MGNVDCGMTRLDNEHTKTKTKNIRKQNKTIDSIKSPIHRVPFIRRENHRKKKATHRDVELMIQRIKRHFYGVHESNSLHISYTQFFSVFIVISVL